MTGVDFTARRRSLLEAAYKQGCPEERIRLGEELIGLGLAPEDFERLNREATEEEKAALLSDLVKFIRRYIVLPEEAAVVAALWVIHTHAIEAFDVTPYLSIVSAEKRSGKSRLLEVLKLLVPKALHVILPSEAVLFRTINAGGVTLLLDESDAFFRRDANDAQEGVRAVLNAGFERGATVPRCLDRGKNVENFAVFCPKALAGIGEPLTQSPIARSESRCDAEKGASPPSASDAGRLPPPASGSVNGALRLRSRVSPSCATHGPRPPLS